MCSQLETSLGLTPWEALEHKLCLDLLLLCVIGMGSFCTLWQLLACRSFIGWSRGRHSFPSRVSSVLLGILLCVISQQSKQLSGDGYTGLKGRWVGPQQCPLPKSNLKPTKWDLQRNIYISSVFRWKQGDDIILENVFIFHRNTPLC